MSKCLVTGGCGFIGSNIVDRLISDGHEVIVLDNKSADNAKFFVNEKAQYACQDISNYQLTNTFYAGVDYVFHLAAESRIGPSIENPLDTVQKNCLGTATVLQCARKWGVKKVMYSSTSSGYGNNPHPNVETQPDDCLNPYSISKTNGEKLCSMYTSLYGLQTVIFRYFNVYGERQPLKGQYAPVVGIFLRQRAAGEPLTIVGDGEQRRDFTYVGDVVNANVMAAISNPEEEAFGQVYNVGCGRNYSVNEVAAKISDNTTNIPPRPAEARLSLANNNKLRTTFGWAPTVKLEDWIEQQP